MNTIEKIKDSIAHDKFIEFLEGKDHMELGYASHFSNLPCPTDWAEIIENGIYLIYQTDREIKRIFEKAILDMANMEIFDLYCSVGIFYFQLRQEKKGISPFNINKANILRTIKPALVENKSRLMNYFDWQGRGERNGAWDYIKKINEGCITYFGFTLIDG